MGVCTDRFASAIVETRRASFEAILRAAAENQALRRSDVLRQFFTTAASGMDRTTSASSVGDTDSPSGGASPARRASGA